MARTAAKWTAVSAAVGAAWAAAGPAHAQGFPPGFQPGAFYNGPFGSYSMMYNQQAAFSYSFMNPFTGVPYSYRFGYTYAGPTPLMGGGGGARYSPFSNGAAPYQPTITPRAGGFNPVARQQLRALQANQPVVAPRRVADGPAPANLAGFARKPAAADRARPAVETDPKLVVPADEDVLSGRVLNALAAAIRDLEAKGAKADPPLLPADLMAQVTFVGSPAAEAIAALRNGVPAIPELLQRQEFIVCRAELEKHLAAVAEPMAQGKPAPAADVDGLAAAVKKCRANDGIRDLPAPDAAVVTRFLDSLDALTKAAKDPALAGVVVPKWNTVGATAAELVRHTDRYKLTFGPAAAGSADAYRALHRGLSTYYTALAAGGVKG